MTALEAICRQWMKDNRGNISFLYDTYNEGRLVFILSCDAELIRKVAKDEMPMDDIDGWINHQRKPLKNFIHPINLSGDVGCIPGELCKNCHCMVTDPIESINAGGCLCRGCSRWYDLSPKDSDDIEWQCTTGRIALFQEIVTKAAELEAKKAKERLKLLRPKPVKHAKHVKISLDEERKHEDDYDKEVDRRLSAGERWIGTL